MRKQHSQPDDAFNLEEDEFGILHSPAGEAYPPEQQDLMATIGRQNLVLTEDKDGNAKYFDLRPTGPDGEPIEMNRPKPVDMGKGRPDPLKPSMLGQGGITFDKDIEAGPEDEKNLLNFLDENPDALEEVLTDFVENDEKIPDSVFEMFPDADEIVGNIEQDLEDIASGRPIKKRIKEFKPKQFKPPLLKGKEIKAKPANALNAIMFDERKRSRGY